MSNLDKKDFQYLMEAFQYLPDDAKVQVLDVLEPYIGERVSEAQMQLFLNVETIGKKAEKKDKEVAHQKRRPSRGKIDPRNKLNDLAGNEWLYFTKTVLRTSYPSEIGHKLRRKHYANKPPSLMRDIIKFFTKKGQTVLDPFAGVGGTLLGASLCGRVAVGIELEHKWIEIYKGVCEQENLASQEVIEGDCLEVMPRLAQEGRRFDAIITDPPYSPALKKTMCDDKYDWSNRKSPFDTFSSSPKDLRNSTSFDDFYNRMAEAAENFFVLLHPQAYAVVMIRDSYQNRKYIPTSFYVAERFRKAGFTFKGIKIWYQTGAPVRPYGYPYAYVPNIVHHNILIFRKEK